MQDDPIFDPWSDSGPATSPPTPPARWRSRSPSVPTAPVRPPDEGPHRAMTPQQRLSGTPGFLRTMAVPRLQSMAQRLLMARHDTRIDDCLEDPSPCIRLTIRPWQGPWGDDPGDVAPGRFELAIDATGDEHVVALCWLDDSTEPSWIERIPTAKMNARWLEGRALSFVSSVLERT